MLTEFSKKRISTFVFMAAVIFTAIILFLYNRCLSNSGSYAVIMVDGVEIQRLSLDDDTEFSIQGFNGGKNLLEIKDGECFMKEADCPDGLCIHQGKISKSNQSIICLPHRVVITVEGNKDESLDAIAR